MLNGQLTTEKDMMPILQVTDLKLIQSKLQTKDLTNNRYKVFLSDGILAQQGMLNTNLNGFVLQGNIQVGSILRLTHFVVNYVQKRRIIIVMNVEIIEERCQIIGNPVDTWKPSDSEQNSVEQQQRGGAVSANTQRTGGLEQQQARRTEFNGGRQVNDSVNESFGVANISPQPQVSQRQGFDSTGTGFPETTRPPLTRPYGSSSIGYEGAKQEQIRTPPTAYSRPVQSSGYQPQPPLPMYPNRGPVARNEAPPRVIPIAALNP